MAYIEVITFRTFCSFFWVWDNVPDCMACYQCVTEFLDGSLASLWLLNFNTQLLPTDLRLLLALTYAGGYNCWPQWNLFYFTISSVYLQALFSLYKEGKVAHYKL